MRLEALDQQHLQAADGFIELGKYLKRASEIDRNRCDLILEDADWEPLSESL
jgi:hypothetical protein